ncbi:hypothetical protein JQ599_24760 [Bradyrhizobium diazoefficiens]|nr:hypothetical protein [Bradyrhizobium diazoefficiens]MBR0703136.1 hypothetical protein [Bradyrhizobium diazoefficiens]MBR0771892.1 hypothetical protein [Bradyrhizobium diazoefficiens]
MSSRPPTKPVDPAPAIAGLGPNQAWARNKALAEHIGISAMGLWRWLHDPELNCPRPIQVNGIQYHDIAAWDRWLRARVVANTDAASRRRERFKGKAKGAAR